MQWEPASPHCGSKHSHRLEHCGTLKGMIFTAWRNRQLPFIIPRGNLERNGDPGGTFTLTANSRWCLIYSLICLSVILCILRMKPWGVTASPSLFLIALDCAHNFSLNSPFNFAHSLFDPPAPFPPHAVSSTTFTQPLPNSYTYSDGLCSCGQLFVTPSQCISVIKSYWSC